MSIAQKKGPRPSDKWIPLYLTLGFITLLAPLAPMAYFAVHTLPGVVTDKAYEEGLAYNKAIAAGTQQKALGWQGELSCDSTAPNGTKASYVLRDAQGNPVDQAAVRLWMVRPVQGGMDRNLEMIAQGDGRYEATIPLPARGVWDLRVSATLQDKNFQTEKRVVLPCLKL